MKNKFLKYILAGASVALMAGCIWGGWCASSSAGKIANAQQEVTAETIIAPQDIYRFHCGRDTVEIGEMLDRLALISDRPLNEIVVAAAEMLEGRPYVGHTLEGEFEQLVINVDQLDCVTFVENCFALARTARQKRRSWREFARNIQSLRYRQAKMDGYASRLHYTTDWINDNVYRGNITDVTPSLAGSKSLTKSLDFMTRNRQLYPALKDDEVYQKCRDIEAGFRSLKIPYMTKESANQKNVTCDLRDGDMISFLSPKPNLDSSHVALLRIIDGKPYMMHASLKAGKVIFEKEPLYNYLKYVKRDAPGFRVLRIKE